LAAITVCGPRPIGPPWPPCRATQFTAGGRLSVTLPAWQRAPWQRASCV
jgi:hypothetical protein